MSNLDTPAAEWLADLFEFEYCADCGGDADHHTAVPLHGNWFAQCKFPRDDDGNYHPVIQTFRDALDEADITKPAKPALRWTAGEWKIRKAGAL